MSTAEVTINSVITLTDNAALNVAELPPTTGHQQALRPVAQAGVSSGFSPKTAVGTQVGPRSTWPCSRSSR